MMSQRINELTEQLRSADDVACEKEAIALGQQGQAGLSILTGLLTSPDSDIRFWAVRGLWANGSPEAVTMLLRTLQDEAEMVRSGAALALGELQAKAAIKSLAQLLTGDHSACGNHAADALAKLGVAAVPVLGKAMQHEQAWVRVRAARTLATIECQAAIPVLFEALEDQSYVVRTYAEAALARMGVGQMVYFQD